MKKYLPLAVIALLLSPTLCAAQNGKKPKASLLDTLSARETALWEAWKNKQAAPMREAFSEDMVLVGDMGPESKAQVIQALTGPDCTVQDFSLSDFKLTLFDRDAALLTYKSTHHSTCGGRALPANVNASSLWLKRGGKWLVALHQETPAAGQN